jgi:Arc/MetJ family transcription regulator
MKSITFKKSSRIKVPKTKNIWMLTTKNMSGDGDHYEEETKDYKACGDIWEDILVYITPWVMSGDRYSDDAIMKAVRLRGVDLKREYAEDIYSDLVGWDITNEQFHASPQEAKITYFDENGVEFDVEIVIGDKCFQQIDEYNIKDVMKALND